jgi:hypothetical protein
MRYKNDCFSGKLQALQAVHQPDFAFLIQI